MNSPNTLFFIFTLFAFNLFSADRYWIGTNGGNWSTPSNWSGATGEPTDNTLPMIDDDVYFDENSGSGIIIVDSDVDISKLTFESGCLGLTLEITSNVFYIVNTITMNPALETLSVTGGSLIIDGSSNIMGGNFISSSGNITSNGSSMTFSTSSFVNLTGGTVNFNGSLNLNNGTFNLNGSTLSIGQIFTISGGVFQANSGIVNINGLGEVLSLIGGVANFAGATINIGNDDNEGVNVVAPGAINLSGGIINVKNYYKINSVTSTISGGTVDIQNVAANGSGVAIDISTSAICTGGLIKVSATNANYKISPRKIYNLEINSLGKTITWSSNCTFFGDYIINNGTTNPGVYTATFKGSGPQSILGAGASQINFYNLTLDNINGLTLVPGNTSTSIINNLTFINGKITLGNYNLNIGANSVSGSISGANSSNYIITNGTGLLRQYNIGSGQRTSVLYPIGINSSSYTPVTLDVSGTSVIDDFSVRVSQNVFLDGVSGLTYESDVVDRTWYISEGTTGGSSITITPQWNLIDELTSFTRSISEVRHYTSSWLPTNSFFVSGSDPYTLTSGVITSFSPFAVFDGVILPITLLEFKAQINRDFVETHWSTSTEINTEFYEVLRSNNGERFEPIDKINAKGNSFKITNYQSIDKNPLNGISYYQIAEHDIDGEIFYSEIKTIQFENGNQTKSIFPNPSNGELLNLQIDNDQKNEIFEITIVDFSGKKVHYSTEKTNSNVLQIYLHNSLNKGLFTIEIKSNTRNTIEKLIIY